MTGLLQYIQSKAPHFIPQLVGTARDCTQLPIHPDWAHHTIFIDPSQFVHPSDSFDNWETSKTEIPNLSSIFDVNTSIDEVAQRLFMYHFPLSHSGIVISDGGFLYRPTIRSFLTLHAITPIVPKHAHRSMELAVTPVKSKVQRLAVTVFANFGLYRQVTEAHNITINPTRNLRVCTKDNIKDMVHFIKFMASCGITYDEVDSYLIFRMKYCLDLCRLPSFNEWLRRQYTLIFISAQHRLLFYPIPSHWKPDHILKYHQCRAVIRHWKETKYSGYNPQRPLPTILQDPNTAPAPTTAAILGVAALSLQNATTVDSSQSSDGSNGN
ncbi:hypothetical protein L218DRAFT_1004353 [Marasmius fiardii PR-910]|nr:hypothetical protein L218DRAFT_1004353 [Marasmius fiardii PR-910]